MPLLLRRPCEVQLPAPIERSCMTIRTGSRRFASVAAVGRRCARGLSVRPGSGLCCHRMAVAVKVRGLVVCEGLAIWTRGRFVTRVLPILERSRVSCSCTSTTGPSLRVLRYELAAIASHGSIIGIRLTIWAGDGSVIRVLPVLKGTSITNAISLRSVVGCCLLCLDPAGQGQSQAKEE